jgi:stage V sporulation protein B
MSESKAGKQKKQKFLQGAAVLTMGTILVKIIGALYKIPMNRIIGTEGFGHFNVAYSIFNVLLTASTAGLPIAVSRLVSQANTLGNRQQVQKIFKTSLRIFLVIGALCSAVMLIFAPQLASWMEDPDAVYAIAVLAPAVLFLCIISSFRGYFQGHQYMTPTAVSQVIEAVIKLVVGLGAVYVVLHLGYGKAEAAGGAIFGVTSGSVLAALYLFFQYRKQRSLSSGETRGEALSTWETAKQLLKLAVPITIGSTGLQIFNALDTKIILGRLQSAIGLTSKAASSLFGTYSAAQTFYMLPPALITPLAISIIPSVTSALTLSNYREARRTEESAIRMTALIALPCGAGLAVLAAPIQAIAYGYDAETLSVAGPLLAILGAAVVFNCMVSVTNAILQAHGRVSVPIYTTLVGGVVNIVTDYVLIGMGGIHIYGAAIATIAYCAVIMFLNVAFMHKTLELPPRILQQFVKPVVATAVMAVAAYLSYQGVFSLLSSVTLAAAVAVVVAVVVYFALVYAMKIITWYDCQLLPKGDRIARLLRVRPSQGEEG